MSAKPRRKSPNLKEKLAAALLEIKVSDAKGNLVPIIDRDTAKTMTAQQIISQFELDHWPVPVALGGDNHPTNLQWMLRHAHREKTEKSDVPMIAKIKRVSAKHEEFRRRLLRKDEPEAAGDGGTATTRARRQWSSRRLESRPFDKRGRREKSRW